MRSWKPHGGKVRVLAFAPDGRALVTAGGTSRFVTLWDALTGTETGKLEGHSGAVGAVEFSPDGRHFASLDSNNGLLVWANEPDGTAVVSKLQPTWPGSKIAFAPNGERLVCVSPHAVEWWDNPTDASHLLRAPTGREARTSRVIHTVAYTPDGAWFLIGSDDLEVWHTDLVTPFGYARTTRGGGIRAIAVSPDSTRAAGTLKNTVRIARLADRTWETTLHWGRESVYAVAFTRDGRALVTAGADGAVRVWDVATWQEIQRFEWGIGRIHAIAFAPDGLTCAACGEKGQVVVWDVDV
jgi:WD40 repeat protein